MLWKPFQFLIMSAVVVCNSIWHWTPNGLAAGLVGAGLAYVVTLVIVKVCDRLKKAIRPSCSVEVAGATGRRDHRARRRFSYRGTFP